MDDKSTIQAFGNKQQITSKGLGKPKDYLTAVRYTKYRKWYNKLKRKARGRFYPEQVVQCSRMMLEKPGKYLDNYWAIWIRMVFQMCLT